MYPRQPQAKVLARASIIGCNAQSFHFKEQSPMHVKRRRLPNFESCSVALFASLAMGSTTLPARAQGGAPSTRSVTSTSPSAAPASTLRLTRRSEAQATSSPAGQSPAPVPDGSISSPGFDEALK
jgi:hypothetical protein